VKRKAASGVNGAGQMGNKKEKRARNGGSWARGEKNTPRRYMIFRNKRGGERKGKAERGTTTGRKKTYV